MKIGFEDEFDLVRNSQRILILLDIERDFGIILSASISQSFIRKTFLSNGHFKVALDDFLKALIKKFLRKWLFEF
jgi:hypothetical protein